jgi:hypothetical protein
MSKETAAKSHLSAFFRLTPDNGSRSSSNIS